MTDRPTNQKQDIEVTPEMVETGVAVLGESEIVDGRLGADMLLVAEIYRAMISFRKPHLLGTRRS